MSIRDSPVVITEEGLLPRGRGGKDKNQTNINGGLDDGENRTYSDDLKSRFGTAFLPYAHQLESVEKVKKKRKRKGRNKKKQPVRVTTIPRYKNNENKTKKLYDKHCEINNDKISNKIGEINHRPTTEVNKLEWQGDTLTLDEGWPNVEKKQRLGYSTST